MKAVLGRAPCEGIRQRGVMLLLLMSHLHGINFTPMPTKRQRLRGALTDVGGGRAGEAERVGKGLSCVNQLAI